MPENENQKPATAEKTEAVKRPETKDKPVVQLETSLNKCAKLEEATCKNPEEKEAFNQTVSKYRLSPYMQMAFNMLVESPGGDEAMKFFGEVALINPDKESAPLPENFNVASAKIELNFSKVGQYFSYEKTPDGTTKVTVKIPGLPPGLQISGLRAKEGQLGGQLQYGVAETGTTLTAVAGKGTDGEIAAVGKVEQAIGSGTLAGTVLYMKGKVTGTIDYKSPQAVASVVINEDSLAYSATFNSTLSPNVALYGNVAGQVPFEGEIQAPQASLGVKADFGKGGTLTAEAYARKGTGDDKDRRDFGATVAYEIPL